MMQPTVVINDSLTDRQKIDKCALDQLSVSSKMSRCMNTLNHASPEGFQTTPL